MGGFLEYVANAHDSWIFNKRCDPAGTPTSILDTMRRPMSSLKE